MGDAGLRGRTVVVTRAADQAEDMVRLLESRGARVILLPTIAIAPLEDAAPIDRSLGERWDMIVFGSPNAIDAVAARAQALQLTLRTAVACVGDKTRAHLERTGVFEPSALVVPKTRRAEALADAIVAHFAGALANKRILYPRAPEGRETLIDLLRAAHADVVPLEVYRIANAPRPAPEVIASLDAADAFTFLSGETLRRFFELLGEPKARALLSRSAVAVIGPVAREAAIALGVDVSVMPATASVEALVSALEDSFAR
jgi:uroporphyrinogen III methyltransferase/synthase